MQTNGKSMLRMQIGPVQDFIAAARTSGDLWSGSYLLSRLMAALLHFLEQQEGVEIIFPCTQELSICQWWSPQHNRKQWVEGAEAPCLSNKLVACVPTAQAEHLARAARAAVKNTWLGIAAAVWRMMPPRIQQDTERTARYNMQAQQHLAVDYAHLPMDMPVVDMARLAGGVREETPLTRALSRLTTGDETARYATIYYLVDHCMNAVRKVNAFGARNNGMGRDAGWYADKELVKDYLTGKEEQVFCLQKDAPLCGDNWEYARYLAPCRGDALGAITLIKRLWYVEDMRGHQSKLPAPNARYGPNVDGKDATDNHYYAVLVMDGDNIGAALTRQNESATVDAEFHRRFSASLAAFAQKKVNAIVNEYGGKLIYAGGDDVLALLPLHVQKEDDGALSGAEIATAVDCAAKLGAAFGEAMQGIRRGMTVSAGLAVVHSKSPLQDAVAAARRAESRAKSAMGRNAFSISPMKRSGEIVEWGAKWGSGAQELLDTWQEFIEKKLISAKGAHRYAELLTPYLSYRSELVHYGDHEAYNNSAKNIALLEFDAMLQRQCTGNKAKLRAALARYLEHLCPEQPSAAQRVLNPAEELVPMCGIISFIGRKSDAN